MYLVAVILAFFMGGMFALLMRLELLTPGRTIMGAATYNRVFTLHGAIMVFLFIIPSIPAALGNFILPIMLGAKDVAFPRLNLMSFYIYVVGAVFCLFSIVSGAVDTGWTFYTPYSTTSSSSVVSMTLGVFILGFSSHPHGAQLHRHGPQAPRPRHALAPSAPLHLGHVRDLDHAGPRDAGARHHPGAPRDGEASSASASSTPPSAATRCSSSTSSGSTRTPPSTS
jgi:hypothetical protein